MLAVTTYATQAAGGLITVVAEGGDNVYLQQVASVPQALYVAEGSSFQNRMVVGGPSATLGPAGNPAGVVNAQYLPGVDVKTIDRILVTSGTPRSQTVPESATGYPMSTPSITRFTLSSTYMNLQRNFFVQDPSYLRGEFSYVQASGATSRWTFDNFGVGQPRIVSGVGVTVAPNLGDVYPSSATSISASTGGGNDKAGIDITWNVPQLPRAPVLETASYWSYQYGDRIDGPISPAAPQSAFVSLSNAAGFGLSPIIPSTVLGEVTVDGTRFSMSSDANGVLYFDDTIPQTPPAASAVGVFSVVNRGGGTIQGRVITGAVPDLTTGGFRRGLEFQMSGSFALSLDSARYALATGGKAVSATVFAGQDITAALDVNLLGPGSSISVDSPVSVLSTRSDPGISLRATSIDVNAPVTVQSVYNAPTKVKTDTGVEVEFATINRPGRLNIGPAAVTSVNAVETAAAVAEVVDGKISKIHIPPGLSGAGYDKNNLPRVTIAAPSSVAAKASLIGIVDGVVSGFRVVNPGSGYPVTGVTLRVDTPAGGRAATGTVLVNPAAPNQILSVNLTDGGTGYERVPVVNVVSTTGTGAQIEASITGALATRVVAVIDAGFGYDKGIPELRLTITGDGSGAAGVALVDGSGRVTGIRIDKGGSGYSPQTTKITIPDPPPSQGKLATATADVDPATTRINFIKVDYAGEGYGAVPLVSIAPPLAVSAAGRAAAVVKDGAVTSIALVAGKGLKVTVKDVDLQVGRTGGVLSAFVRAGDGGEGYAVNDVVVINSDNSNGGSSAQFRVLEVDAEGSVQRVAVVSPGLGYKSAELLSHLGAASAGRGYKTEPRVFVGRPDDPNGVQATAVANIDKDSGAVIGFNIVKPGSGYSKAPAVTVAGLTPTAVAETARFNAKASAGAYDISLADDPFTTGVDRSTLYLSQVGAFASERRTSLDGNVADAVRVEVRQGDILLEGSILAKNQSYVLQSGTEDQHLAPFKFTTGPNARVSGGDVAITLANDLPTRSSSDGAMAFNELQLRTAIDSLRVRAARIDGREIVEPFPYRISIDESSGVNIDALASSSFPIEFKSATGIVNFNAALRTAGGLSIIGDGVLTTSAPISTTRGQISLSSREIQLRNALSVTDEPIDEAREDVVLDASAGAISLDGNRIYVPGRIAIRQRSAKVPQTNTYTSTQSTQILSGQTVSVPLSVSENFTFDDVSATVSIAVTNTTYSLRDLSAQLVAPNGASFRLFDQFDAGFGTKAMTDTRFNSRATQRLNFSSKEPYTGSFVPSSGSSIEGLYNRGSAGGQWRLEVTAASRSFSSTADLVGAISGVTLALRDPVGGAAGGVYGTTVLAAKSLLVDAEGDVGDSKVQPNDAAYYLNTDVESVDGFSGGAFSLADANDVAINSLRSGGLVSLLARGSDLADGRAALWGRLTDVPSLDVSSLGGSVDIEVVTANTLEVGNKNLLALAAPFRTGLSPMRAAGNVSIRTAGGSQGGDIVVLDAPVAGGSARTVRTVASSPLPATYSPGIPGLVAGTITANSVGSIGLVFPGMTPALSLGDRVLVAGGVGAVVNPSSSSANGIYVVKHVGSASTKWVLVRASDADTLPELPSRIFIRPADKTQAYQLTHDISEQRKFGLDPLTVKAVDLKADIGSGDSGDWVSFVVSTPDGTNDSPGSLGRMIQLRQRNTASSSDSDSDSSKQSQKMDFAFAGGITVPITLAQELPPIEKAFAIDGKNRYPQSANAASIVVDGSRITRSSNGATVYSGTKVNGFSFTSTAGDATQASAGSLSNVVVGGFNRGSAIQIDGAQNVAIRGVIVGVVGGVRLPNDKGILVTASSGNSTNGVTIADTQIGGSSTAGISLEGSASGVKVVGTKVGFGVPSNTVGILVSATGVNSIGDVSLGRNFINNNGTGIRLKVGSVTVTNTQVANNAQNGIVIEAGKHTIGRIASKSQPRDAVANEVFGNGGFGVVLQTAAIAKSQVVQGNLMGIQSRNARGDVAVGSAVAAPSYGFAPNAKTGVDSKENQYYTATATPSKVGGPTGPTGPTGLRPTITVKQPWRARRR